VILHVTDYSSALVLEGKGFFTSPLTACSAVVSLCELVLIVAHCSCRCRRSHTYDDACRHYASQSRSRSTDVTRILSLYEGDVTMEGQYVRRKVYARKSNIPDTKNVRVNYGIIRVMQSCFLASHRMSATSSMSARHTTRSNRSSATGG
jgi:hypothetical protein